MHFSGSQPEGDQKDGRDAVQSYKNTPRENPQGVFSVQYYLVAGVFVAACARCAAGTASATRGALVDTSVYLKPTELVDVALDVLARLAPCLNLGVGELGHKDLLDTIGANNCRK